MRSARVSALLLGLAVTPALLLDGACKRDSAAAQAFPGAYGHKGAYVPPPPAPEVAPTPPPESGPTVIAPPVASPQPPPAATPAPQLPPGSRRPNLGPLLPYPSPELPRWAQGVCPPHPHPPAVALPAGVEWPLPASWWTRPRPCPDGATLENAEHASGDIIQCKRTFTKQIRGQTPLTRDFPHGPLTVWNKDGSIRDESVRRGFKNGFSSLRQRQRLKDGCGERLRTQLEGGELHVSEWDGHNTLRVDRVERSRKPVGCVRTWDHRGELVQVSYWDKDRFVAMKRRPGYHPKRAALEPGAFAEYERERITRHLANVEEELRAVDTSLLSPSLRAARARNLDTLHDYWTRGRFPVNDRGSEPTPFFIDTVGTACAVGHLMIESGRPDLASAIAARENNDYLADIDTPGVTRWIEHSGLTAEEHARIQPTYCGRSCPREDAQVCLDNGMTTSRCYARECVRIAKIAFDGPCDGYVRDNARDCRP